MLMEQNVLLNLKYKYTLKKKLTFWRPDLDDFDSVAWGLLWPGDGPP